MTGLAERFAAIVRAGHDGFPEFDLLRPGGELRLDLPAGPVERIRVGLDARAALLLPSLLVETADGLSPARLADLATVTASSWAQPGVEAFSAEALLTDGGAGFRSTTEDRPWVELAFAEPIEATALRLRSVDDRRAQLMRDVRVEVAGPGAELAVVYDASTHGQRLQVHLDDLARESSPELQADLAVMVRLLGLTICGRYPEARAALKAAKELPVESARTYKQVVNSEFLMERSLEWTSHGPLRSFRFWSEAEKVEYIRFAVELADTLAELTPNVSFGYGAALATVRDHDLIPHDDDLDLIIGFEPHEAATLTDALALIERFLTERGYTVRGDFFSHRHVGKPGQKKVDVFCGLFEGDRVSWYPGVRRGLARDAVFPTTRADLLGVSCPLPARPEEYLATIYGPGWNSSDPGFKHTWRKRDFADQVAPAQPAEPEPESTPKRGWLDRLLRR